MVRILLTAIIVLGSCITTQTSLSQITNPAPYCDAGFDDNATVHYISRVVLGTLDNNSGTTQWPALHYVFYNNLNAPDIQEGSEQTLTVNHDGNGSTHFAAAWIDFDQNNIFEESERIMQKFVIDGDITSPIVTTFTVPSTASTGATRMRVMVMEDDNYTWIEGKTSLDPCTSNSFDWGETEDYIVNIKTGQTDPIEIIHNKYADTIPQTTDYKIDVTVKSTSEVSSVILYCSTDSTKGYQPINMNHLTNVIFQSVIPGQPFGTRIFYYIKANAANGISVCKPLEAPKVVYSFFIGNPTSVDDDLSRMNTEPRLLQNFPNPFRQKTTISFSLEKRSQAAIIIYDVAGNPVYSLGGDYYDAGEYATEWNGQNNQGQIVNSGVYFYQLRVDGNPSITKEMIILK